MHRQQMCLIVMLLKVEQSAFTQAFFSSLSGSTSARVALNGPIFPWQADSLLNHHMTG